MKIKIKNMLYGFWGLSLSGSLALGSLAISKYLKIDLVMFYYCIVGLLALAAIIVGTNHLGKSIRDYVNQNILN